MAGCTKPLAKLFKYVMTIASVYMGYKAIAQLAIIAIIIILIIVVVAGFLILSNIKLGQSSPSTTYPTNLSISGNVSAQLPVGKMLASSQVTNLITAQLNSESQFNITYSGNASISGYRIPLGGLSISVPISVTYEKYGNSSRLNFVAMPPIVGNIHYDVIEKNSTASYYCTSNLGALDGTSSGQSNYTCTESNSTILSGISGITSLSGVVGAPSLLGNYITFNVIDYRSYKGLGCVFIYGNGSSPLNSSFLGGNVLLDYNVSSCLSGSSYIPLNITGDISVANAINSTQTTRVIVSLDEVSIGMPVTSSEVTTLPGNVV